MALVRTFYVPFLLVVTLTLAGVLVGSALAGLFIAFLLLLIAELTA